MFSACFARLSTNLSGYRLQLLTSSQISKDNCFDWGTHLSKSKHLLVDIPTVKPILERLTSEPEFMVGMVQHDAIITGVIKLTSSFEYFLNDLVSLCMMRNYSLLKKGLKDIQINPFDIVEIDNLKMIRYKYIDIIAHEKCKGELWSKKLKRACSFLGVSEKNYLNSINKTIDSIWKMRNVIAHSDSRKLTFTDQWEILEYTEFSNEDMYINFIIHLIKAVDSLEDLMKSLDNEALKKWPAENFEH